MPDRVWAKQRPRPSQEKCGCEGGGNKSIERHSKILDEARNTTHVPVCVCVCLKADLKRKRRIL